jgi:signal transduction histidine kinase
MVMMGGRKDDGGYSVPEVEFLSRLASQTAIAIEHAVNAEYQEGRLKRVLQADKLATVGELAAGAAHEIRNPLTSIRSTIQWLKRDLPVEKHPMADGIIEEVDRIDGIIKGLLSLSRTSDLRLSSLDLQTLLGETLTLLEPECRSHDVIIQRDFAASPCTMLGDPSQLKQLFLNILLNAIQANSPGGTVNVAIRDRGTGPSAAQLPLEVAITDTGSGIPDEILSKVFDPFFTTKENGTGLGLSISYGIASKHGGEIEIESRCSGPQHGTTVAVRLPKSGRQEQ